jgi:hypothetical protein
MIPFATELAPCSACRSKRDVLEAAMIDQMQLIHLRRDVRSALELAIVALAPAALVERLGTAAGLLEALAGLPSDAPPVAVLAQQTVERTRSAIEEWGKWHKEHTPPPA